MSAAERARAATARILELADALGAAVAEAAASGADATALVAVAWERARHAAGAGVLLPAPCSACVVDVLAAAPPDGAAVAGHCPHHGVGYALRLSGRRVTRLTAAPMTAEEAAQRRAELEQALAGDGPRTVH